MEPLDGGVTNAKGFRASGVHCGLKHEALDLGMVVSDVSCTAFIGLTTNRVRAAPVRLLDEMRPRTLTALVVNSGNANALTGETGMRDAESMAAAASRRLDIPREEVAVASTGVIGRFMPMDAVLAGIEDASGALVYDRGGGDDAARAIMTTDTMPKQISCTATLSDGRDVTIGGMAKGVGMIHPSMRGLHATTICVITTDAPLTAAFDSTWQSLMDDTINMVSVDGDQSTNDTCVLLANGMVGGPPADGEPAFIEAVGHVLSGLSRLIAIDGEGATKLMEVVVTGAKDVHQARSAARAISSSSLVKAAVFGADPNFGRVFMALGNSEAEFDEPSLRLDMGAPGRMVTIVEGGSPVLDGLDGLEEGMRCRVIRIVLDLGVGEAEAMAFGCDLSYEYVRINAEYTT